MSPLEFIEAAAALSVEGDRQAQLITPGYPAPSGAGIAFAAMAMAGVRGDGGFEGLCVALRYVTLLSGYTKEQLLDALDAAEPIAALLIRLGTPWSDVQ